MAVHDGNTFTQTAPKKLKPHSVLMLSTALVAVASAVALHNHGGMSAAMAATVAISMFVLVHGAHILLSRGTSGSETGTKERRPPDVRRGMEAGRPPLPPLLPNKDALRADPRQTGPAQAYPGMPPLPAFKENRPLNAGAMLPEARTSQRPPFGARDTQPPMSPPRQGPPATPNRAANPPASPGGGLSMGTPASSKPATAPSMSPPPPPGAPSKLAQPSHGQPPHRMPTAGAPKPASPLATPANPPLMQDYWSFRPAAPRLDLPPFVAGRTQPNTPAQTGRPLAPDASRVGANAQTPAAPPAFSGTPREADVEVIQDAIKKLLAEVNAAEGQAAPFKQAAARTANAPAPTTAQSTKGIESSLEALRFTADTMRAASQHGARAAKAAEPPSFVPVAAPGPAQETWKAAPKKPSSAPMGARAAVIAQALSEGRMDVLLEPILGLEDQRTRHFEVAIRLRDATGAPLTVTGDGELRGTGLLPLFDCARIARVSAVASRLEERGKSGSLFSSFTGESLSDDRFLGDLTENVHKRAALAGQLVLTFAQDELRDFGPAEWDTIADMRALGFRFALAGVTHLDMDFEELAGAGFAYIKLDADVFLRGLPIGGGSIPANDVCRHLAKLGLTLVVERIDDEDKLARVFGFGVLFGQGQLFGGARSMKAAAVASGEAAA